MLSSNRGGVRFSVSPISMNSVLCRYDSDSRWSTAISLDYEGK